MACSVIGRGLPPGVGVLELEGPRFASAVMAHHVMLRSLGAISAW